MSESVPVGYERTVDGWVVPEHGVSFKTGSHARLLADPLESRGEPGDLIYSVIRSGRTLTTLRLEGLMASNGRKSSRSGRMRRVMTRTLVPCDADGGLAPEVVAVVELNRIHWFALQLGNEEEL